MGFVQWLDSVFPRKKQAYRTPIKYKSRINKAKDFYLDGEMSKGERDEAVEWYSKEAKSLQERIDMLLNVNRSNIEPKLDYAMLLINNMERYLLDAPVEAKIKLIGSMFPEKIEFDGSEYRTNHYNKVLDLIYQETNKLRGCKNKKSEEDYAPPDRVPRPAFEIIKVGKMWVKRKMQKNTAI